VGHGHNTHHSHHTCSATPAVATEGPLAPSREASVVLDIGPHAGALVVYTGEELSGAEIEIRPGDGTWQGVHTAVRERHVGGRVLHAGVFGSLPEGTYDLRRKDGGPESFQLRVEVVAGSVTEATVSREENAGRPVSVAVGKRAE
jgi:hypothetical protein